MMESASHSLFWNFFKLSREVILLFAPSALGVCFPQSPFPKRRAIANPNVGIFGLLPAVRVDATKWLPQNDGDEAFSQQ